MAAHSHGHPALHPAAMTMRWLTVAFIVFALTLLGTFFVSETLATGYIATEEIKVEPGKSPGKIPQIEADLLHVSPLQEDINAMESPGFLLAIVKDKGLDRVWAERIFDTPEPPMSDTESLDYIRWRLKIEAKPGTHIILIHFAGDEPKEAAEVANAIGEKYRDLRNQMDPGSVLQPGAQLPVQIITPAAVPSDEKKSNPALNLIITVIVGVLLSILVACWVEMAVRAAIRRKTSS
ncbi:MAG: hypothetical protein LV479_07035 [Methylacidiphilales bacterium]|nr:hypothetical protein [Candidatus Methylacidiphilales bacterium]